MFQTNLMSFRRLWILQRWFRCWNCFSLCFWWQSIFQLVLYKWGKSSEEVGKLF